MTVAEPAVQVVVLAAQRVDLVGEWCRRLGLHEQAHLFLGGVHLQQSHELGEHSGRIGTLVQGGVQQVAERPERHVVHRVLRRLRPAQREPAASETVIPA